jgi:hypothetical protein
VDSEQHSWGSADASRRRRHDARATRKAMLSGSMVRPCGGGGAACHALQEISHQRRRNGRRCNGKSKPQPTIVGANARSDNGGKCCGRRSNFNVSNSKNLTSSVTRNSPVSACQPSHNCRRKELAATAARLFSTMRQAVTGCMRSVAVCAWQIHPLK